MYNIHKKSMYSLVEMSIDIHKNLVYNILVRSREDGREYRKGKQERHVRAGTDKGD